MASAPQLDRILQCLSFSTKNIVRRLALSCASCATEFSTAVCARERATAGGGMAAGYWGRGSRGKVVVVCGGGERAAALRPAAPASHNSSNFQVRRWPSPVNAAGPLPTLKDRAARALGGCSSLSGPILTRLSYPPHIATVTGTLTSQNN